MGGLDPLRPSSTNNNKNVIKAQAKDHEVFRKLCIRLAQRVHKTDVTVRLRLLGEKGSTKVRPLNDTKAIESGANFLSETFVFAVAGVIIVLEGWRTRQKEITRRVGVEDDIKTLQHEIEYLKKKLKEYHVRLDDYKPLADLKPSVLKLDEQGNSIDIQMEVSELNKRLDALEPSIQAHLAITKNTLGAKTAVETPNEISGTRQNSKAEKTT